jgi:integrase/recombinase XerC
MIEETKETVAPIGAADTKGQRDAAVRLYEYSTLERYAAFLELAYPHGAATRGASMAQTSRAAAARFIHWAREYGIEAPEQAHISYYINGKVGQWQESTAQVYLSALRKFFRWTEREGIYPNIMIGVKGVNTSRDKKARPLTLEQLDNTLGAILNGLPRGNYASLDRKELDKTRQSLRDMALITLAVTFPLSPSDLIDLKLSDVSIDDAGNVTVQTKTRGPLCIDKDELAADTIRLYVHGLNSVSADIANISAVASLRNAKHYKRLRHYLLKPPHDNTKRPFFASYSDRNYGKPITKRSLRRIIQRTLENAGEYDGEGYRGFHSLRLGVADVKE